MRILWILLIITAALAVYLPEAHKPFMVAVLASVFILYMVPDALRRQMFKVETYVHELCHGLASLMTEGRFHRFKVNGSGGVCLTSGGSRWFVTSAGYVGTVLLGALFLAMSTRSDVPAVALHVITLVFSLSTFKGNDRETVLIGHHVAAVFGLVSFFAPGGYGCQLLLNLMGVLLVWRGFRSIWVLFRVSRTQLGSGSDAEVMARLAGGSPAHWSIVYGGIALVSVILVCCAALHVGAL